MWLFGAMNSSCYRLFRESAEHQIDQTGVLTISRSKAVA